jgi:hypothetical protein
METPNRPDEADRAAVRRRYKRADVVAPWLGFWVNGLLGVLVAPVLPESVKGLVPWFQGMFGLVALIFLVGALRRPQTVVSLDDDGMTTSGFVGGGLARWGEMARVVWERDPDAQNYCHARIEMRDGRVVLVDSRFFHGGDDGFRKVFFEALAVRKVQVVNSTGDVLPGI